MGLSCICLNKAFSLHTSARYRHLLFLFIILLIASCSAGRFETVPSGTDIPGSDEKREQKRLIASWYGPGFHGKPTASGEIFDMHAFTCAHKEYPFGTKLKVLNEKNSKETECLVNDRGPFVPGRELDLSYAAAKAIGLVGPGSGPVLIELTGRDLRYVKYIRANASEGLLTLQVGSFKEEQSAQRLKTALEDRYKEVYVVEANVRDTTYYRVRIGKFTNKKDAYALGETLADEGYAPLITKFEQQLSQR